MADCFSLTDGEQDHLSNLIEALRLALLRQTEGEKRLARVDEDCGDGDILAGMRDVGGDCLALTAGIEAQTWQSKDTKINFQTSSMDLEISGRLRRGP